MARYVILEIEEDDLDFILKFNPDRDRTCSRAELVEVLLDIQEIVSEGDTGEVWDREED